MFHTRALNIYIDSRNKTNKCTCVKSVYRLVFIANMCPSPSGPTSE